MLPKADRKKYKEKHDMRAMNCFIGKRVFLPLSIACTISPLFIVFEDTELMKSTWVGILITVAIFAFTASIFYAVAKILGGKFER